MTPTFCSIDRLPKFKMSLKGYYWWTYFVFCHKSFTNYQNFCEFLLFSSIFLHHLCKRSGIILHFHIYCSLKQVWIWKQTITLVTAFYYRQGGLFLVRLGIKAYTLKKTVEGISALEILANFTLVNNFWYKIRSQPLQLTLFVCSSLHLRTILAKTRCNSSKRAGHPHRFMYQSDILNNSRSELILKYEVKFIPNIKLWLLVGPWWLYVYWQGHSLGVMPRVTVYDTI